MRLLCKPTRTWSGNTLLAVVVLVGCIVTVVCLFVASGGSARRVCERLGLSDCYDPLPVVSRMAAYNPMHAVFATLATVGAVLLRNSVVAFIAKHQDILEAYPSSERGRICRVGTGLAWCPSPLRRLTAWRLNPFGLVWAARISADLAMVGLAGLSIVSLAQSWWIHNVLSSLFFFFGYAMCVALIWFQSALRADFPEHAHRILGDDSARARVKLAGLALVAATVCGLYIGYWERSEKAIAYGYLRAMIQYVCLAGLMGWAVVLWLDWRSIEQQAHAASLVGAESREDAFSDIDVTVERREGRQDATATGG
jgi:hypothetical protein